MERCVLVACAAVLVAYAGVAAAAPKPGSGGDKQTQVICQALGLGNRGYVRKPVGIESILKERHHGEDSRDIIPEFKYELANGTKGTYPGLNWDEMGKEIWENGCVPKGGRVFLNSCISSADGSSYAATFGYQNNRETVAHIPVGADNAFSPGTQDRGQPVDFQPGGHPEVFTVAGIPANTRLTWTVSGHGLTSAVTVGASDCSPPAAAARIGIAVQCVANHGATFDATFGYKNVAAVEATIPVGANNRFYPAPEPRGQPTHFAAEARGTFTVTGIPADQNLVWALTSDAARTATASATDPAKCSQPPPPNRPIGIFVTCVADHGSTYDAVFGYQNEKPCQRDGPDRAG
jgi:hypothetical protein